MDADTLRRIQRLVTMLEMGMFDKGDLKALQHVMRVFPGDLVDRYPGLVCQAAFLLVRNDMAPEAERVARAALQWSVNTHPKDTKAHEDFASYVKGAVEAQGQTATVEDILSVAKPPANAGLFEKVRSAMLEYVRVSPDRITPDANLEKDLRMGVGDVAEFIFDVEDWFDVSLGNDLTGYRTVQDVLDAVEKLRGS